MNPNIPAQEPRQISADESNELRLQMAERLAPLHRSKPGYKTTEFWLSAIVALIGLLLQSGVIPTDSPVAQALGGIVAAITAGGYAVSRGHAKRAVQLLCLLAASTLLSGCISVPANKIHITGPTGSYSVDAPKNTLIENFKASLATNGTLNIEFTKWASTNDAQVINRTAAGQAAVINAYGNIITNSIAAGVTAAKTP